MRSQIMFGLGIAMFLALIFGATLISQYSGDVETTVTPNNPADGPVIVGSPLLFSTTDGAYIPTDESVFKRYFNAFHEVKNEEVRIPFWFKNPYPVPVFVSVRGRSCTSCTSAYLSTVPPEAMQKYLLMNAFAGLPASPMLGFSPIGMMQQAVLTELNMERMMLDFEKPNNGIEVPAARDENTPTWGIFEMVIKVSGLGPKSVSALMSMQVGKRAPVPQEFRVSLVGMPPFDIEPKKIDLGDMVDGSAPRNIDLFCFSATRSLEDFPSPTINVNLKDAFVEIGKPIPLSSTDLDRLFYERMAAGTVVRLTAGYRVPVVVHRKNPNPEATGNQRQPDIGPFERQIGVGGIGTTVHNVTINGTVVGIVSLAGGSVIDLKEFSGRAGTEKTVQLVSDRMDLELELLNDESTPRYLNQCQLEKPRVENGRKYWGLKVFVPKDAESSDLPKGAFIMLRGKSGTETFRIRIPIVGRAFARGA